MIKSATFTSVWDDGIEITSQCMVNTESKEVFDIKIVDTETVEILKKEYITMDNQSYPVVSKDERSTESDYWYN